MKKNDFNYTTENSEAELTKELEARKEKVANLKFDLAAGKVKNIREIRHLKKEIAKLMTLLSSKGKTQ